eukprot:TRINITY_DN33389_c3_g1_i1.p2 TRINITY_DN33389_c3_g1~~TRINITY_DN33389_c3_g1_i1.p2  ORF type:complete len:236 (+),score=21.53 TRINITY_DN33389_c3_g1_i1:62-769(+)
MAGFAQRWITHGACNDHCFFFFCNKNNNIIINYKILNSNNVKNLVSFPGFFLCCQTHQVPKELTGTFHGTLTQNLPSYKDTCVRYRFFDDGAWETQSATPPSGDCTDYYKDANTTSIFDNLFGNTETILQYECTGTGTGKFYSKHAKMMGNLEYAIQYTCVLFKREAGMLYLAYGKRSLDADFQNAICPSSVDRLSDFTGFVAEVCFGAGPACDAVVIEELTCVSPDAIFEYQKK